MTTITTEKIEELRRVTLAATPGNWNWWTSNSFRRLSSGRADCVDGDVLHATVHPIDHHPDIVVSQENMDFIAAFNPNTVSALLDLAQRAMVPQPQGQALPELQKLPDWYGAMYDMIRFCVPAHMEEIAMSRLRDAARASQLALPAGPVPADALVTMKISISRDLHVTSDIQTHDNSFAEVLAGFKEIRSEIDRVFLHMRDCPHFPTSPDDMHKKIIRAKSPSVAQPVADERDVTLPYEQALSELVGKIDPDLDSGNIVADAHAASRRLDSIIGLAVAGEREKSRLDFIEANPQLSLRFHKKRWALIGMTNYEYEVFKNLRDAIDAARAALCPPAEEGDKA